ncbi:endonuclease MutS2 [Lederbergia sp. NSJ-179]|uniref:endonuclease MutS2 n=1 Tax=Lederbergia sp. NSJ-179 TaxID=2931402 RepID=UPI001FCFBE28|nr:endonuclease MutS2 [Lederbergia sp. NSJ-179]MCJ7841966.1 endonuclease MutS2 [Lederbergia sp. NSJ-179]
MNENTFEKLQYNELKEIVKSYCVSGLGKQLMDTLTPSSNLKVVKHRLTETTEARAILDAGGNVPFIGVSNIEHIIDKLDKGIILDPEELFRFSDFLRGCRRIKTFMCNKEMLAPTLAAYANSMTEFAGIEEEINFSIKNNQVDSAASKELKRVRFQIQSTEQKIKERLHKFLNSSTNKKYIQEFVISIKDDRYTIPIKASYKNQVHGSVIEISSKGSTVFMEPNVVGKLSVELATLKSEEDMLEYQILATLTGLVAENLQPIKINIELISQYDMIFAKAKYSRTINGIEPNINEHGNIKLVDCKHPLLSGHVVPLQFQIGSNYRSLIITGPNAGGKTIVLKTIGLVTLATMSGFHITASKETEIAIFDRIFVDIGDNQSLENALSTFSSHMKNLSEILQSVNNNTLLLFDEIGSGTEPNEGAALAISLLEEFYLKGCITAATTHYGEIKRFSELHNDFMNAAMQFNHETLEPLYKLLIGQSGDSNALWISRKMNVPEHVLKRAEDYMKNKEYRLERINESRVRKPKPVVEKVETHIDYQKGDRVKLLDHDDIGIVYKEKDDDHNVTVFYQNQFIEVNEKRLALELKAVELYPEDYDLDTLFIDYKTRKQNRDIERGSKKALREVNKEIRRNKQK